MALTSNSYKLPAATTVIDTWRVAAAQLETIPDGIRSKHLIEAPRIGGLQMLNATAAVHRRGLWRQNAAGQSPPTSDSSGDSRQTRRINSA